MHMYILSIISFRFLMSFCYFLLLLLQGLFKLKKLEQKF